MTLVRILPPLLRHRTKILHHELLLNSINKYSSKSTQDHNALTKSSSRAELDINVKPLGEKVKETTKTASYLGIILLGVGVTGTLFYAVFNELFSSKSPNNIYSKAVKFCKEDSRVQDKLGLPISAHGMETRRGRRQHVQHVVFERNGRQCLRMKFYLHGAFHKGTVHLEMVEDDSGKYEYRYLFIQVDDMLKNTIILEDNRSKFDSTSIATPLDIGTY